MERFLFGLICRLRVRACRCAEVFQIGLVKRSQNVFLLFRDFIRKREHHRQSPQPIQIRLLFMCEVTFSAHFLLMIARCLATQTQNLVSG